MTKIMNRILSANSCFVTWRTLDNNLAIDFNLGANLFEFAYHQC